MRNLKQLIKSYKGTKSYKPRSIMMTTGEDELAILELDTAFSIIFYDKVSIAELYEVSNEFVMATTKSFLRGNTAFRIEEVWNLCAIHYQTDVYSLKASDDGLLEDEIRDFVRNVEYKMQMQEPRR